MTLYSLYTLPSDSLLFHTYLYNYSQSYLHIFLTFFTLSNDFSLLLYTFFQFFHVFFTFFSHSYTLSLFFGFFLIGLKLAFVYKNDLRK